MTAQNERHSLALAGAQASRDTCLNDLIELLRFPTIASLYPENRPVFDACVEWLCKKLRSMGFQRAQAFQTGGPPVVYADWLGAGASAPTLLVYGHYDVMPVDPEEAWRFPPFEPRVVDGRLYGRGASDDKGQLYALLCGAAAWLAAGGLPINLKILLEGEEETTSPNLESFLAGQRDLLRCDGILLADMGGLGPQNPLVMYGTRGNCAMEIEVQGPAHDLHSGTYGGAVDNPMNVLTRLLAALQDGETRRVLVPGFYAQVRGLTAQEQALGEAVPVTDAVGLMITGAPALGGETGYPLKERVSSRPTFEVHGITGGFTGPGIKTVIPAWATAKISFRLVPDQAPEDIFEMVRSYLVRLAPPTVRLTCRLVGQAEPMTVDLKSAVVRASIEAYHRAWGVAPGFVRGGGSLPVGSMFQRHIHPHILLTGFGLPEDREHAPNESFAISQFFRGIEMMVHYLAIYRDLASAP